MADQTAALYKLGKKYLDSQKWQYAEDTNQMLLKMDMNLQCAIDTCRVFFSAQEEGYLVLAFCPTKVRENRRAEVAELITRLNYNLKMGKFTMDYDDGEIRYENYVYCPDYLPSMAMLEYTFDIPMISLRQYSEVLMLVMCTNTTPKAALAKEGTPQE